MRLFDNNAQILIVASITISVLIVVLGVVTANLSNVSVNLPREKSYAIYSDYIDIRQKFGTALYQNLYSMYNESQIINEFDHISYEFSNIANMYGNFFNAECIKINYDYHGRLDTLEVKLTYRSDSSSISEEVEYNVW